MPQCAPAAAESRKVVLDLVCVLHSTLDVHGSINIYTSTLWSTGWVHYLEGEAVQDRIDRLGLPEGPRRTADGVKSETKMNRFERPKHPLLGVPRLG